MRREGEGGIETGEAEPGPDLIGIQQLSPSAGRHSCSRREGRCAVLWEEEGHSIHQHKPKAE